MLYYILRHLSIRLSMTLCNVYVSMWYVCKCVSIYAIYHPVSRTDEKIKCLHRVCVRYACKVRELVRATRTLDNRCRQTTLNRSFTRTSVQVRTQVGGPTRHCPTACSDCQVPLSVQSTADFAGQLAFGPIRRTALLLRSRLYRL